VAWTEETIVRDITLITAASKDLEVARYVQGIFSNNYFRLKSKDQPQVSHQDE